MVVRTEHMWDDLQNIEHMVGGGVFNKEEHIAVDHGSSSVRTRSKLSPEGAKTLCCALQNKIAIHVDLLMKASNLNKKSRNESLSDLWNKCDVKSFEELETTCRTILPEQHQHCNGDTSRDDCEPKQCQTICSDRRSGKVVIIVINNSQ
jgi:hypothetical protein